MREQNPPENRTVPKHLPSIQLPEDDMRRLHEFARVNDSSVSRAVRVAIRRMLQQWERGEV